MRKVLLLLGLTVALSLGACGGGTDLSTLGGQSAGTVAGTGTLSGTGTGTPVTPPPPPPPPIPSITSFTPTSGVVGDTVIITGSEFGTTPGTNTVKFNGATAVVTAASATSLTVTVPSAATSGAISVTTTAGTGTSAGVFVLHGPGILTGDVRNAVTNAALMGASVTITGIMPVLSTDINGIYTTTQMDGLYSFDITNPGYISTHVSDFALAANVTNTVETIRLVENILPYNGLGTVSGKVTNAFTGLGLAGVTLNFRSGINTTVGAILATTTTDTTGAYSLPLTLPGGNYTAEAVMPGYTTGTFTVTSVGGQTEANQNGTITPVLPPGEIRIILTWGMTPGDLDSYLTGPLVGTTNRFRVYYASRGSNTAAPFASLDVDDTNSYGPETTTIKQQIGGKYTFCVHDFPNRGSTISTALSASRAKVRVYNSTGLVGTYNVPINQVGTLWKVVEINGNTFMPIGTLSNTDPMTIP